jgi:hypothetical protein
LYVTRLELSPHAALELTALSLVAVSAMMYGFGDESPAADTIGVMEELVIEHISDVVRSFSLSSPSPS